VITEQGSLTRQTLRGFTTLKNLYNECCKREGVSGFERHHSEQHFRGIPKSTETLTVAISMGLEQTVVCYPDTTGTVYEDICLDWSRADHKLPGGRWRKVETITHGFKVSVDDIYAMEVSVQPLSDLPK